MKKYIAVLAVVGAVAVAAASSSSSAPQTPGSGRGREATVTVGRRDFVRSVRLSGTVEAVQSTSVSAPRLAGPNTQSLVITRLIRPGVTVKTGDLLVEFDRQLQVQTALDRRAELTDLDQQIKRKDAEIAAARARDDSEIQLAESALSRAKLEMVKNDMVPRIQAEKNQHALEQADARLTQLRATYELKRKAADADLEILKIRRTKAENAMKQAETNARRLEVKSPIDGMAVIRTVWKSSGQAEIVEGEEVRAGVPVVDIVNPSLMRVRARVNQADINELKAGQRVRIGLDAYPDLSFTGSISQISPIGTTSTLSQKVRNFIVLVQVEGSHPNLMPDLTAYMDVELSRVPGALVVPRDAVRMDGERAFVVVRRGDGSEERAVTLGEMSRHEVVITGGLEDGAVVARNIPARKPS